MRRIEASYALVRPVKGNTWRESAGSFHPPPPLEVSGRVSRSDAWSARMADKVPGSKRHYPHRHRLRSPLGDTFFVSRVLRSGNDT
ncbi:hypothetical protein OPV22_008693 [Ensete ventricosum]|uniref:Uncharacterized protein n=1 Tax=Ensete ventricosum TaxID=4639 RepID=A0AAV8RDD2_ENSVE|nr:hypothetical protein OPV22_008693 [Ensete ventricosum]